LRTNEPALAKLVVHGIGECFHRLRSGDDIAVNMDERMELIEAKSPVSTKQCKTSRSQGSTREDRGLVVQRR
jgi:hypothetical protein